MHFYFNKHNVLHTRSYNTAYTNAYVQYTVHDSSYVQSGCHGVTAHPLRHRYGYHGVTPTPMPSLFIVRVLLGQTIDDSSKWLP